jgi:cytochrome P450
MSKENPKKIREKDERTDKKRMTRRQLLKIGAMGAGASAVTVVTSRKGFATHGRSPNLKSFANLVPPKLVPPSNNKEEELMQPSVEATGEPLSPLAAATHPDPYPYYAKLVAENPIYWDADLKLWVASSAEAVKSAMTSPICKVRPPAEPVPKSIVGSAAGDIFQQLVRQNDGPRHSELKELTATALNHISAAFDERSRRWARDLSDSLHPLADGGKLNDFIFGLSVYVIADLLGLPDSIMPKLCVWVNQLTRCFSPLTTPEQIDQGNVAAARLLETFKGRQPAGDKSPAAVAIAAPFQHSVGGGPGGDASALIANQIGFFTQSYEGIAALIGTTLLTLASNSELHSLVLSRSDVLEGTLDEVLRYDSPVQNTRRFLSSSGTVAGKEMKEGNAVLVILAAANRDRSLNPEPQSFQPFRKDRQMFAFGMGVHACMGPEGAKAIAKAAITRLLDAGIDLNKISQLVSYRRSLNVRVPVFGPGVSPYT